MAILFQENASGCFFLQRGGNGAAKKRRPDFRPAFSENKALQGFLSGLR
jgi:hypothetical protein